MFFNIFPIIFQQPVVRPVKLVDFIQNDEIRIVDHLSGIFFKVVLRRFFEKTVSRADEDVFYSVIAFNLIFHIKNFPSVW